MNRNPALSEFLKQKRGESNQKSNNNNNNNDEVEFMYISPTTTTTLPYHTKIITKETIKIICGDQNNESEMIIPYEAAIKSKLISNIFAKNKEMEIQYKERQDHIIRLPQFKADVLEEVSFLIIQ